MKKRYKVIFFRFLILWTFIAEVFIILNAMNNFGWIKM